MDTNQSLTVDKITRGSAISVGVVLLAAIFGADGMLRGSPLLGGIPAAKVLVIRNVVPASSTQAAHQICLTWIVATLLLLLILRYEPLFHRSTAAESSVGLRTRGRRWFHFLHRRLSISYRTGGLYGP